MVTSINSTKPHKTILHALLCDNSVFYFLNTRSLQTGYNNDQVPAQITGT